MQHNVSEHGGHDARGVHTDHIFDLGEILFQNAAFVIRHFGDVAGIDAYAIVGKNTVGRSLLEKRNFGSTQRYRQIRRNVRCNAEAVGVVDHSLDAKILGQLQRWNVAGLCQCTAKSDGAFKLLVVIVRNVWAGRGLKRYRPVHDRVIGLCPLINGGGIDVGFEG